jgi:hypothetical protein
MNSTGLLNVFSLPIKLHKWLVSTILNGFKKNENRMYNLIMYFFPHNFASVPTVGFTQQFYHKAKYFEEPFMESESHGHNAFIYKVTDFTRQPY